MTESEILDRFRAERSGEQWKARCPGHDDRTASLSIGFNGDKVLLKCFAGCKNEDIVSAVGLQTKDLFLNGNGNGHSKIVAIYDYRDSDGTLRYQSVRYEPKDFKQRRPNGPDRWIWKIAGVDRLPYRLNELKGHTEVWIAEGEKDVDRLWDIGLAATCNNGGAGKWTDGLTAHLVAAGVTSAVCIPDNDDPGRAHMLAVAASCRAAGIAVRMLPLPGVPDKGDVSDYLNAGHTKADLLALYTSLPVEGEPLPEPEAEPEPTILLPEYSFEPAFGPRHFVTRWIEHYSRQSDAAHEFHEAAALVALATATPTLLANLSGSAHGLGTNLYVLFVGKPGWSRKSSVRGYNAVVVERTLGSDAMLPDLASHEGMIEALTRRANAAALWSVDEFTDMLGKLVNTQYLSGIRMMLLELYDKTHYEYKRVSKKRKKDDDPEDDALRIENVRLSLLACATPTIFQSLDNTAVGSGLLSRFAIVMPESKPARLPLYELDADAANPSRIVMELHRIAEHAKDCSVRFADGVLAHIDAEVDAPLDEAPDRGLMTERIGMMARKVAMLAAAGRPLDLNGPGIVVTMEDAASAIRVARRWMQYARAFESRTNESTFEINLQRCLSIVQQRSGWVPRRIVAQQVHMRARELEEVEATLLSRGLIDTRDEKPVTGRSSRQWKAVRP